MTYVLINRAPDGTHTSAHKTEALAVRALVKMLGRPVEFEVGQTYYSDWGNALTVEERFGKTTARSETALREAFDARECGVATKRQLALLEKRGF